MFYMHNFGWGWWVVMSVGMVAFWALVIWGIVSLIRGADKTSINASPAEDPREILRRRLAQGEITVEEYRRVLETLEDQPQQPPMAA